MRLRSLIPHAPGVAFIAATLGFGIGNVLAKVILDRGVNALELLPIRYLFAVLSLLAVLAASGKLKRLDMGTWRKGSVLGVINMAAPSILMTIGLENLSASVTALLVGLIPLTTVAFAHHLIDGERMHRGLVPGFALALIGTGLLVEGGGPGTNPALGLALVVSGVLAAGAGGALTRRFALGTPAAELVLPQFVAAAAVVVVAALASGSIEGIGRMDLGSWGLIALLGTAATTLPFGALLWLSESTTAARVALIAYLVPLVGVAGGVLILDEPLGWRLVSGGALILAGVILGDRSERRAHSLATVSNT
ncbi:MAG: DMT family transporter [Acidimicrobiia bacterium]